jgi:Uma2 family endonuclease
MSNAAKYQPHYTVKDYEMWEGDWELWFGVAVAMSPAPFAPHERFVTRLVQGFMNQIDSINCDCEVFAGLDWYVSRDTVVRPDVMIVCGEKIEKKLTRAPKLAVEVLSAATLSKDLNQKRALYESHGVEFYWIVDTDQKSLRVLRLLDRKYVEMAQASRYQIELNDGCSFEIDTEALFR